ncbi:helix-turn-helix domain-containing protein [Kitasatospora sp. LaBMicrA B282]|uniref:helix-turn-helix domain-containing protein n=1 Tax=Kitasatospora sp. LaBMicrA B282 TaxID=3420949 RepID=UPI003D0AD201
MSDSMEHPATWRYCGNQLRLWRTHSGTSREQLAQEADYDYETVKSMEQGRRRPSIRLLQVADAMFGAQGRLLAGADYLQPERRRPSVNEYMSLEAEAIGIHSFDPLLIPGLLQTEEYMRALMNGVCPIASDETTEQRVQHRLERQKKLTSGTPALFSYVIYEAALRSMVGGPTVMRRQVQHLLTVSELSNVSLQVLPAGPLVYFGLDGTFVLLETAARENFAYVEAPFSSVVHSDPEVVGILTQRHGMLRMQALNQETSADYLARLTSNI